VVHAQEWRIAGRRRGRGFDLFVTTDTNLKYQQNLATRRIGIVVLSSTSWPRIKAAADWVVRAIGDAEVGAYMEVVVP
jgi:hypothetical protein